jgi:hypothetical protein
MTNGLSTIVLALLRERVESFEQLEVLLLVRRRRDTSWTADGVATQLRIDPRVAEESLDQLCRSNLVDVTVGGQALHFRYDPGNAELEAAVDDLARAYADDTLAVMKTMNANAVERVRTSAMRTFANAFVLGEKDKKKDG